MDGIIDCMRLDPLPVNKMRDQPFTIHTINNYTNVRLTSLVDHLDLQPEQMRRIIQNEHKYLVTTLRGADIEYSKLGHALVPKAGRFEAAFIFDSMRSENVMYGYSFAEQWIPALKMWGPEKTALRVGDILELPSKFVWRELERHMVGSADFPRQAPELYFVVYVTNLSARQLRNMDAALTVASNAYLGYVNCTTWNPLKAGMYLPQVGLRLRENIITEMDDRGNPNQVGYPYEGSGFRVVGVQEDLYGTYLSHRLDNGRPAWADDDSAIALTVLGGDRKPVTSTDVVVDQTRIVYLGGSHGASLRRAGLDALDIGELVAAIKAKFTNGIIYNLRFIPGSRDGVSVPELNAMMYSVQVEFPNKDGEIKRYQLGLKYTADTHTSEIVTFF